MVSDEEEEEENIVEEASEWDGTFEPVTVIDSDECSFVVTGLEESSYGDFVLNIELENKSSEGTYSFDLIDLSINGITGTGIYYEDLAPGEKITDVVDLSVWNDLEEWEIDELSDITDIKISMQVDNAEDMSEVAYKEAHIYPQGEENAIAYHREDQDTDLVLFDNDYAKVVYIQTLYGTDAGMAFDLYVENKTDTDELFTIENIMINDAETNPFWLLYVDAGECSFSYIKWSASELEEAGIEDIEAVTDLIAIQFDFRAVKVEDFTDYFNETCSLNLQLY